MLNLFQHIIPVMTPEEKRAEEIPNKLKKLLERYDRLQQEVEQQRETLKVLKGRLKEKEDELKTAEKDTELSSFARALGGSELGAAELRIKLNQYIREIDKVIMKLKADE